MVTVRVASLAGLLLAVAAVAPVSASGAELAGEVADPVDSAGGPGQDIAAISSSFDQDAGTWTETVRFHGRLTTERKAMLYSSLAACGSGVPGDPAPPVVAPPASMQTWTDPADSSVGAFVGGVVNGVPTWGPSSEAATKQISDDRRTLTLTLTDPLLRERGDVCFVGPFRLSAYGTVFDRVAQIELKPRSQPDTGDAGRPGMPEEGDDPPVPDSVAPTANVARRVVVASGRRPLLEVSRISEPAQGTVVVRRRSGGRVVARGHLRAVAGGMTVKVPLRLSGADRAAIDRRGRMLVTFRLELTDEAGNRATIIRRGVLRSARRP